MVIAVSINQAKWDSKKCEKNKKISVKNSLNHYQKASRERKEEILKHQEEEESVTLSRKDAS